MPRLGLSLAARGDFAPNYGPLDRIIAWLEVLVGSQEAEVLTADTRST